MILADTNIFLEILLDQKEKEKCKTFLKENIKLICLSDFSLHSIGVILFRNSKSDVFTAFVNDIVINIPIIPLSNEGYNSIEISFKNYGLDFDDAYQFCIGKENNFEIATMDSDFKKVAGKIPVHFI